MKNCYPLCILFLSLLYGCSKSQLTQLPYSTLATSICHSVSEKDVASFLLKDVNTKAGNAFTINALVDNQNDTLLFIASYKEGWKLFPADKRLPPVIAYSDKGSFSYERLNPAAQSWMTFLLKQIKLAKRLSNEELNISPLDIYNNYCLWSGTIPDTLRHPDLPINPDAERMVKWRFDHTETHQELVETVPHLTETQWDQLNPYNDYCPLDGSGTDHCAVGCAAVAGGQMLYYLYQVNGTPSMATETMPMSELGTTYLSNTDSTALFLRSIGEPLEMHYGNASWSLPSRMSVLFSDFGYTCTYSAFDASTVKNNLLDRMPVIILAFENLLWDITDPFSGHYFLIDGYQKYRTVDEDYYLAYDPVTGEAMALEPRINRRYSAPYVKMVKMNWGWWSQWTGSNTDLNDAWFYLSESWVTSNGTYDYSRQMYTNFSLL